MRSLAAGTLSFVGLAALPGALLALALYARATSRSDPKGDLFVALYLLAIAAGFRAIGFLIPTAMDRRWRRLAWPRAVLIAGCLGLLAPLAHLGAVAVGAEALLPLFRSAPMLAVGLPHVVPAAALGIAALLVARATRPKPSATGRE